MRNNSWKLGAFVPVYTLLLAVLLYTGCKDKTAAATSPPKIFRIANSAEPSSLDPSLATGVPFDRIDRALFVGLTTTDPRDGTPLPGLAERWDVSADGKTYTFHLRPNLKWSDGQALTADDFVYSWLRILNPETGSNYAWFPAGVVKGGQDYLEGKAGAEAVAVRALDKQQFQVEFVAALPYILEMLSHFSFGAVPKHVVKKFGSDWIKAENYVSSGPYKLVEWQVRERIVLEPNPYFYDQDQVQLDQIIYLPVEDSNTAYNMLLNGEVDWITNIPVSLIESVADEPRTFIKPYLGTYFFNFNTQKAPFDDLRVRKAFSLVVDLGSLANKVLRTGVVPTNSLVPPMAGFPGSNSYQDSQLKDNINTAKELLAAAGYPNGEGFPPVKLYYNTLDEHKKVSEFLQEQWRVNLGVEVELNNMEWKTFLQLRRSHDFDIARNGWIGDYRDPSTFLELFSKASGLNDSNYLSEEFNNYLQQAKLEPNPEKRMKILSLAEEQILNDYAILPVYFYVSKNMIDTSKWDGWYPNIMDYHPLGAIRLK